MVIALNKCVTIIPEREHFHGTVSHSHAWGWTAKQCLGYNNVFALILHAWMYTFKIHVNGLWYLMQETEASSGYIIVWWANKCNTVEVEGTVGIFSYISIDSRRPPIWASWQYTYSLVLICWDWVQYCPATLCRNATTKLCLPRKFVWENNSVRRWSSTITWHICRLRDYQWAKFSTPK